MTPEAKVKAKVKKILNEMGAYYAMPMGTGFGNSGVPDFLICIGGLFYAIECKANGNKPTALQLKHLDDIRKAGGIALVIDETNVENLRKELSHVEVKASIGVN
jgi:pantoate kinase